MNKDHSFIVDNLDSIPPNLTDEELDACFQDATNHDRPFNNDQSDSYSEDLQSDPTCIECNQDIADCDCEDEDTDYDDQDHDALYGNLHFANPGGNSALRASSRSNPRNLPCPNCEQPNRLTPEDQRLGYQCDSCADAAEFGFGY